MRLIVCLEWTHVGNKMFHKFIKFVTQPEPLPAPVDLAKISMRVIELSMALTATQSVTWCGTTYLTLPTLRTVVTQISSRFNISAALNPKRPLSRPICHKNKGTLVLLIKIFKKFVNLSSSAGIRHTEMRVSKLPSDVRLKTFFKRFWGIWQAYLPAL